MSSGLLDCSRRIINSLFFFVLKKNERIEKNLFKI